MCNGFSLSFGTTIPTLSLIDIRNIHHTHNKIDIQITARIKRSGKNKPQPSLELSYFENDPNLCITEPIRGSITSLFLTIKKPHKKATTQTLGRWVKSVLVESGIDTRKFTAHCTRHAATLAAARKGLHFDTIRLTAGWSKNSKMFAAVYNRRLVVESKTCLLHRFSKYQASPLQLKMDESIALNYVASDKENKSIVNKHSGSQNKEQAHQHCDDNEEA
nr:unnamed protein product [Callosobruchus chinensis]